jgi:hypothetical protein
MKNVPVWTNPHPSLLSSAGNPLVVIFVIAGILAFIGAIVVHTRKVAAENDSRPVESGLRAGVITLTVAGLFLVGLGGIAASEISHQQNIYSLQGWMKSAYGSVIYENTGSDLYNSRQTHTDGARATGPELYSYAKVTIDGKTEQVRLDRIDGTNSYHLMTKDEPGKVVPSSK